MKRVIRGFSGYQNPQVTDRELRNRAVARKAAANGVVLMKNNGVLPLSKDKPIGLFGGGAVKTIKGGTGSGDVNCREMVSIYEGLKNAGFQITSTDWLETYREIYDQARIDWKNMIIKESENNTDDPLGLFSVYSANPFSMPRGREIRPEDVDGASAVIYVISRVAGEATDRFDKAGDYYLSEYEEQDLKLLSAKCENLIILLNTGAQIDMKFIHSLPNVGAIVLISQPGMEGGNGVADVLCGDVVPSGKLTDTWAENYEDFPNSATFSHNNGDIYEEYYNEGIYVGYRYFTSFGVKPAYPFGFGLSYTEFSVTPGKFETDGRKIYLTSEVRNTGDTYCGREVTQVYASCPQSGIPKELKRLCGFKKTGVLRPGESEILKLSFPVKELASFSEEKGAWILEKGEYAIWLGNSSENNELVGVLSVEEETVVETVNHICPVQEPINEIIRPAERATEWEKMWKSEAKEKNLVPQILQYIPEERKVHEETELEKKAAAIVDKLSDSEMADMVIGEMSRSQMSDESDALSAIGSAGKAVPGSAAESSHSLIEKYDVAPVVMADGPAGLRLLAHYWVNSENDEIYSQGMLGGMEGGLFANQEKPEGADTYYQYCTAFPVGVMLAQSWDPELISQVGKAVAEELVEFGVSWWLAPGMNIHRNPLCGRNFEYYSEDPLVAGVVAAAMTRGVQSVPGVGTTLKHFALNNQEDNRYASNSRASERTIREIYLKGFEIAVKSAQPMTIMTSYNLINGVHSSNCHDICTEVARNEWDFRGVIMTDWLTTTMPDRPSSAPGCVKAGNDLIMPGVPTDKPDILAALENGELDREKLRSCVRRIINVIFQTLSYEDCVSYLDQFDIKPYLNA